MNTKVNLPDAAAALELEDQPTLYLNWHLELANGTVLTNSSMRLVDFSGQEQLSNPFSFTLTLHGNSDPQQTGYKISDLIGRGITIGVCLRDSKDGYPRGANKGVPNGGFSDPFFRGADPASEFKEAMEGGSTENFSFFNGMVTGFTMGVPGVYSITMKPAAWRMMLTNDYKVHSQLSIRTAIESLMARHKISYNTQDLIGDSNSASNRIQDWLQAGETDYEFLQRLLAKQNIHYYFVHGPNFHQMVFSNKASYPKIFIDDRKLLYTYSELEGVEKADTLQSYKYSQEISATSVTGSFTRQEEAWESDTVAGEMSFYSDPVADSGDLPFHVYKIIQYGGSGGSVNGFSNAVTEMIDSSATQLEGDSHNAEIRVGHKVQLEEGKHSGPEEVCSYLNDKWFVFTEAQHQAGLDGTYSCRFKATEADGLITPFATQETHQGTILAEVVAHCHGEIPTTWKYYEKTAFDSETSPDVDSSSSNSGVVGGIDPDTAANPKQLMAQGVFVRFTCSPENTPVFVKLSAGMQTCPEIGSMVIVARATDDSELPEIQQSVQANGSKVVTPSGWTSNSHVGSSYSTSYGDSKSIRYGRMSQTNLAQAIAIISAQYETGKFKDSSFSQGGGYSYSTSENGRSGMLNKSDSFGNSYSHHEGDVSESYSDITRQDSITINGTTDSISTINSWSKSHHHNKGDAINFNQVDGLSKSTNIQNIVESENTTKGTTTSTNVTEGAIESNSTFNGKVTDTSVHNADVENHSTNNGNILTHTKHTGNAESTSTQDGNSEHTNTVTGNTVSKTTNTGDVSNTSTTTGSETTKTTRNQVTTHNKTATSTGTSLMGASTESSATGVSNHNSVTGASANTSLVGASVNVNLLGAALDTSLTGARVTTSLTGSNTDLSILGDRNSLSLTTLVASLDVVLAGITIRLDDSVAVSTEQTRIEIPMMHMKV